MSHMESDALFLCNRTYYTYVHCWMEVYGQNACLQQVVVLSLVACLSLLYVRMRTPNVPEVLKPSWMLQSPFAPKQRGDHSLLVVQQKTGNSLWNATQPKPATVVPYRLRHCIPA